MAKPTPKEVAEKEVNMRINTKEQAKEQFINWINKTLGRDMNWKPDVIKFWEEVKKETEKL